MRSAGIDCASTGLAAVACCRDGVPWVHAVWKPDKKESAPERMLQWSRFIDQNIGLWKPDVIAVEQLAVFMNKNVIRALANMEGVALLQAKKRKALVVNPPISQARSIMFKQKGVRSKEDAYALFKDMYPDYKLPAATSGGMDVVDAITHAVAGPVILERRR